MLNQEDIKKIIPHRDNMLLVQEAEKTSDTTSFGRYTVSGDEFFLKGHFPGNPIVPGVILCEIMAQGSVLLFHEKLTDKLALYVGMDKVRFKHSVHPGDKVVVHSRVTKCRGAFISVDANATVGDEVCATGQLSFMLVDKA